MLGQNGDRPDLAHVSKQVPVKLVKHGHEQYRGEVWGGHNDVSSYNYFGQVLAAMLLASM